MTETVQGVAQEFMDTRKRSVAYFEDQGVYTATVKLRYGLSECEELLRLLSAEARAMLAEIEDQMYEAETRSRDVNPYKWHHGHIRDFSRRLGLDLEGDE